jgi:hypothetical protein
MKIKALFIVLLMALAADVALALPDGIVRYKVTTIEDNARVRDFVYMSYEQVYRDEQERAKNELLPADQEEEMLSFVPQGGLILVQLLGAEWRMANGTNWTYLIIDDTGKELFRARGNDHAKPPPAYETRGEVYRTRFGVFTTNREVETAPEKTPWGDPVYVVQDQKEIPVSLPDSFKVYVIDGINKNRCCYALTKRTD